MRHDQRNSKKPKEVRNKRRRKVCCECGRKQRYLSKHLQKQHGYIQGTKRSWRALKESRPVYQSSASLAQNFVEMEGDSPGEEATETSNQFKEIKKVAAPRGHVNDNTGTLGEASSTSTVDKVIVVESASDGEDDLEYLEECEESDDAVEVQTEACDQQSKRVFEAFEKWILSPDGGEKDARPAALVVRQVQTILSIIGTQTVESLFDKALIRDKFYPESRASHRAATTISYLHSLRKFYTFATTEDDIELPRGCEKTADALFKKCGQWCKSLRKEVKERFWEKQEEDLARLITPEKVQEFAKSEFARNQVKVIGDLIDKGQNSTPLGQIEYCDLRNFLFIHLLSQNGHRSGVITNSTLDEYKEMSCVDETYMISVKDHKTYSQHGPANLCFDESLKSWLDIYVEHARQQVVKGGGSTCLFLNWKGAKMQSSDLSSAITSAWRKGGTIDKETRISGTLMRKSCTTAIRQYNKEVKGNVAAHMAHTERTADKHYHLVQKRTNSAFAARQLTAVMHGRPSSPAVPSRSKNNEIEQPSMRKDDFDSPPEGKEDGDLDAVPVPPVRQTWTKEEERAIKETFADNISRQSITLREVLALKRTNPLLVDCENKRLLDKVRAMYRFKKSQGSLFEDVEASDCNDNASDSNSIISPTTTQGKLRVFEEEEVMVFSNLFKDLIQGGQKIESKDVAQRLNESGHKDIIQKYSKQKVTDKIRGLRATYIRQWRK
ncbi:uncharacterized protein [Montipora foliosa]|uniref:uncharacterized protein n=1 Tax=Montipora foliosa TaxID=591990 RepID=UPI0035F10989